MAGNTREQRLWNLLDGLTHDACIDAESASTDLREAGVDPDDIGKRGHRFVQGLQSKIRLSIAKAKRQRQRESLPELRKRAAQHLRTSGEPIKDVLRRVLSEQPGLEVSFRNIESLDPEDAVEILGEIALLELLDETEDN